MSTDFIALFDVSREEVTLEWLLPRVKERPEVFADFVEKYGHKFRPKEWAIEAPSVAGDRPMFVGPGGLCLPLKGAPWSSGMAFGSRCSPVTVGIAIRFGVLVGQWLALLVLSGPSTHMSSLGMLMVTLRRLRLTSAPELDPRYVRGATFGQVLWATRAVHR